MERIDPNVRLQRLVLEYYLASTEGNSIHLSLLDEALEGRVHVDVELSEAKLVKVGEYSVLPSHLLLRDEIIALREQIAELR